MEQEEKKLREMEMEKEKVGIWGRKWGIFIVMGEVEEGMWRINKY